MSNKAAKIQVLVVPPFGAPSIQIIDNTLAELQAHVGGNIECFPVGITGAIGLCNEEGLLMRLPLGPNVPALGHPVCGTFVVVGDAGEEFGSLATIQTLFALKLFGNQDESPIDLVFPYEGLFGCASQCRVRIFDELGLGTVVILDDRAENAGTDVTTAIDLLAMQICDAFGLDGGHTAWIEHHADTRSVEERAEGDSSHADAEQFAQARFSHVERDDEHWILGQPGWEPLSFEQVESLIGVEWEREWE